MNKIEEKREQEKETVTEMREKIRIVMRYSGPRMLFVHPVMCIKHLIDGKNKTKINFLKLIDTKFGLK